MQQKEEAINYRRNAALRSQHKCFMWERFTEWAWVTMGVSRIRPQLDIVTRRFAARLQLRALSHWITLRHLLAAAEARLDNLVQRIRQRITASAFNALWMDTANNQADIDGGDSTLSEASTPCISEKTIAAAAKKASLFRLLQAQADKDSVLV